MMNLTRYDNNGLELIIDESTGEVFASQSALARMSGKGESTIRQFVISQKFEKKEAQIETATGLKTSQLLNEDQIYITIAKYNPELLIQCAKAGLRLYLHGLAGYKYEVKQVEPEKPQGNPARLVAEDYEYIQGKVTDNPRLAQLLIDSTVNYYLGSQLQLEGTTQKLRGVVEIAEEMGFKPTLSSRSTLGKFIVSLGFTPQKEKRLINGTMREVNCYEDTELIRESIKNFFEK